MLQRDLGSIPGLAHLPPGVAKNIMYVKYLTSPIVSCNLYVILQDRPDHLPTLGELESNSFFQLRNELVHGQI